MKIKQLLTLILLLLTFKSFSKSDDIIDNDSLLTYYLQNNPTDIDTGTDAIILSKKQKIEIVNWGAWDNVKQFNFTESNCYKILDKKALDLAEIAITSSDAATAKHIQIYVCYLENGKLVKEKITKSDAIKENLVEGVKVYKFNVSELKVGRILYYSFTYDAGISFKYMDNYLHMRYAFEEKFPMMEAHFEFVAAKNISYKIKVMNMSFDSVNVDNNDPSKNTFFITHKEKVDEMRWSAYNLKKLEHQPYVKDFDSKIKSVDILFDYGRTHNDKKFLYSSWKEGIDKSLFNWGTYYNFPFGAKDSLRLFPTIKKIDSMARLPNLTFEDSLNIAKELYAFVRDSIKTIYPDRSVHDIKSYESTLRDRKGTVYEKNNLLTILYQRLGYKCRNVLLSTDEKLDINEFNPTAINYMIAALLIGKNYYLLDPGYKFLPFGVLAPKCYNGLSFVLNGESTPYNISPHNYNDKLTISYSLAPKDSTNSSYQVKLEKRYGKESASTERAYINSDSTGYRNDLKDYITNLKYNFTLQDYNVKNESNVDSPLVISYNLDLKMEQSSSFTYFNPFINKLQSTNPFKDIIRKYPVEFDLTPTITYLFKMTLPPHTQLEEYPESKVINFKDKALAYEQSALYDNKKNTFFLSYTFRINAFEIPVSDYAELRNYFESILTEQSKQIVLKNTSK